ncbi:glycosyltransferase [Vibrio gallicus]|uniref:glycosyltransferase n=1 Tax=Vibrio gallicus TaxID=190897 RepID=UPI0021C439D9|nr:glycosyltransferase [Vibrio gallicus]
MTAPHKEPEFIKKNICFVNTSKNWGGGEKWHFVAATICAEDANCTVITHPNSSLENKLKTKNNISIFNTKISNASFLNPLTIFKLYRHFKKNNYQSVILNLPADAKCAGLAAKLAKVPKIIYRRGMPHPIRNTFLNRIVFGKIITDVIVNSDEIGRSITKNNPRIINKDQIHTIYNGVEIESYSPKDYSLEEHKSKVILGTAGRCVNQKNQLMLMDLVKDLKDKGYNIELYIAGTGPLESKIKEKIITLGLEQQIKLLGFVEDTPSLLSTLDIYVFPSHYEGSANALVEAMATAIPSVTYNVSSMPEMVKHNQTGKLANYEDPTDFLNQVEALIKDRELRVKLGHNARKLAESKFNNKVIFTKIKQHIGVNR